MRRQVFVNKKDGNKESTRRQIQKEQEKPNLPSNNVPTSVNVLPVALSRSLEVALVTEVVVALPQAPLTTARQQPGTC